MPFRFENAGHGKRTTPTGIEVGAGITSAQKMWRMFTAFGDIAIAYTYSPVLIEVQVNYFKDIYHHVAYN